MKKKITVLTGGRKLKGGGRGSKEPSTTKYLLSIGYTNLHSVLSDKYAKTKLSFRTCHRNQRRTCLQHSSHHSWRRTLAPRTQPRACVATWSGCQCWHPRWIRHLPQLASRFAAAWDSGSLVHIVKFSRTWPPKRMRSLSKQCCTCSKFFASYKSTVTKISTSCVWESGCSIIR